MMSFRTGSPYSVTLEGFTIMAKTEVEAIKPRATAGATCFNT